MAILSAFEDGLNIHHTIQHNQKFYFRVMEISGDYLKKAMIAKADCLQERSVPKNLFRGSYTTVCRTSAAPQVYGQSWQHNSFSLQNTPFQIGWKGATAARGIEMAV